MAITSHVALPSVLKGKGWTAEILPKIGKRGGMSCIYKIRLDGKSRRAGLYLKEYSPYSSIAKFDVAGNQITYHVSSGEIKVDFHKHAPIADDKTFEKMLRLTLVHFECIPAGEFEPFTPPPKVDMTIPDEVAALIPEFGVF